MGRVHLTLTFPAYELKQLVILLKKKKKNYICVGYEKEWAIREKLSNNSLVATKIP